MLHYYHYGTNNGTDGARVGGCCLTHMSWDPAVQETPNLAVRLHIRSTDAQVIRYWERRTARQRVVGFISVSEDHRAATRHGKGR